MARKEMARDVEGLYSKRPIQCVASSEILEIPKLYTLPCTQVHFQYISEENVQYKNPGMSAS
jgi:hypothetical protein